jgi:hypothetical protein
MEALDDHFVDTMSKGHRQHGLAQHASPPLLHSKSAHYTSHIQSSTYKAVDEVQAAWMCIGFPSSRCTHPASAGHGYIAISSNPDDNLKDWFIARSSNQAEPSNGPHLTVDFGACMS